MKGSLSETLVIRGMMDKLCKSLAACNLALLVNDQPVS